MDSSHRVFHTEKLLITGYFLDPAVIKDKESYKIGEFAKEDLKPASSKKNKKSFDKDENLSHAKEKSTAKKDLSPEEIEEMEYEKAKLESESIDDIYAEVEDIDDIPIISVDSKEK